MMNPATRQMQLAAVPKLLPPSEMHPTTPHDAAREVQGRLLAGVGQRGDRIHACVIIWWGAHGAEIIIGCSMHEGTYLWITHLFRG